MATLFASSISAFVLNPFRWLSSAALLAALSPAFVPVAQLVSTFVRDNAALAMVSRMPPLPGLGALPPSLLPGA